MRDLTPEPAAVAAAAAGRPMTPDDLTEVTHSLNAFLEALAPLATLLLESLEPVPFSAPRHRRRPAP